MKKARKILITIILIIISIIVLLFAAGTVYYNLVLKDQVSEIVTTFDELIKSGELYEQLKPLLEEQANKGSTTASSENILPTATPKAPEEPENTPTPTPQPPVQTTQQQESITPQFSTQNNTAEAVTNEVKVQFENTVTPGDAPPPPPQSTDAPVVEEPIVESEEEKKTIDDYNNPLEYVKDNTSASDFARGISLASRIDIGYVVGLLKGGLTLPEKKELYRYLETRFSIDEMYEGVAIFNKYAHLFE